jgi:hypothetical protein
VTELGAGGSSRLSAVGGRRRRICVDFTGVEGDLSFDAGRGGFVILPPTAAILRLSWSESLLAGRGCDLE